MKNHSNRKSFCSVMSLSDVDFFFHQPSDWIDTLKDDKTSIDHNYDIANENETDINFSFHSQWLSFQINQISDGLRCILNHFHYQRIYNLLCKHLCVGAVIDSNWVLYKSLKRIYLLLEKKIDSSLRCTVRRTQLKLRKNKVMQVTKKDFWKVSARGIYKRCEILCAIWHIKRN